MFNCRVYDALYVREAVVFPLALNVFEWLRIIICRSCKRLRCIEKERERDGAHKWRKPMRTNTGMRHNSVEAAVDASAVVGSVVAAAAAVAGTVVRTTGVPHPRPVL